MSDPIIQKAKADLAEIKAQVAPLLAKQRKLEAFLSIYSDDKSADSQSELPLSPFQAMVALANAGQRSPAKAIVTNAVYEILSDGNPRPTRQLLGLLTERNIEVGGADKVLALSALLSRDDRFQASRAVGWSLKE